MADSVNVEGASELRSSLKKLEGELGDFASANVSAAERILADARSRIRSRTGRLASSGRIESTKTAAGVHFGGALAPYAGAVHFGVGARAGRRGPHNIQPNPFATDALAESEPATLDVLGLELDAKVEKAIEKVPESCLRQRSGYSRRDFGLVLGDVDLPDTWTELEVQSLTRDLGFAEQHFARHKLGKATEHAILFQELVVWHAITRTNVLDVPFNQFDYLEITALDDDELDGVSPTPPDPESGLLIEISRAWNTAPDVWFYTRRRDDRDGARHSRERGGKAWPVRLPF